MKVSTRKGNAKKGSGDEVANTCSPQNILAAVIAKRIEPKMPTTRTQTANPLGTLVSRRAAHHKAVPAPNEGTLPSRFVAVPISIYRAHPRGGRLGKENRNRGADAM